MPVELANPVTRISWGPRGGVEVETARGQFEARAVIVTVSTNVLAAGKIKFTPDLPKRQLDAAARLKLGSYDHVVLELPGNPLGLRSDELVFEKSDSNRTAALFANVSGTPLCMVDVAGSFGRDLAAKGDGRDDRLRDWPGSAGFTAPTSPRRSSAARHPLEQRALGARRLLGRRAGRRSRPAGADGVRCATASGSPARPRTRRCGARSAAPGNPASAPPMR